MRNLVLGLGMAFGLMACVDATQPIDTPAQTSPTTQPQTPQLRASANVPRRDARQLARDFIEVVNQLEPVAEAECRRRLSRGNCDFLIVVDDSPNAPPNAFQTVDETGRPIIAFTLALLRETQNKEEIAFVMAHEAAHHIAGHLDVQRRNAAIGAQVFGQLAGTLGTDSSEALETAQEIGALVGARTFSQEFELEADEMGARIAHLAGYDPLIGAQFFTRIPDPGDHFLSSHPPNAARIAAVQRVAARL
ncbi:M48 family metalloprotease [Aestuariibius sp. HNIBRBA575]|uniref:M48 family metalloprotease n=1 Tax=Aestuariibius sp. HNIBRBA575 TaxID=3233343 RepID=UPI0034A303D0